MCRKEIERKRDIEFIRENAKEAGVSYNEKQLSELSNDQIGLIVARIELRVNN